jgi:hypothetical protein
MYSLLHMYICALQICTPLYLFFKFVTEKILKREGPSSKSTRQTFLAAKLKRKKNPTIYFHFWVVFRSFLVFFLKHLLLIPCGEMSYAAGG